MRTDTGVITIDDLEFGEVSLTYSWWYNAIEPNAGWHARLTGVGTSPYGAVTRNSDGISYESVLWRYGRDALNLHKSIPAEQIVSIVEKHLECCAKIHLMSECGDTTATN
jgi:hypothetical protein